MKDRGIAICSNFTLMTLVFYLILQQGIPCYAQQAESLLKHSIVIDNIEFENTDFSDLMPLKEKIKNARVVVLGEITHSDGSTMKAKTRMVKFLHEEMGFDVLAWEAGFIDCWFLNNGLRADIPLREAKNNLMRGGWDASFYIQPLFEYVRESWNTEAPLEMAGFDQNRPPNGTKNFKKILNELTKRSRVISLSESENEAVDGLLKCIYGYLGNEYSKSFSKNSFIKATNALKSIYKRLENDAGKLETSFSPRFIQLIKFSLQSALMQAEDWDLYNNRKFDERNLSRDKHMAERFNWLQKELYPNRKIIIWAASAHLMRNANQIVSLNPKVIYTGAIHMGHYLYLDLKEDLYTIAFTTHHGNIGSVYPEDDREDRLEAIPKPLDGSYEDIAHKTGKAYLFTDLKNLPEEHWLQHKVVAYPFGLIPNETQWGNIIDAFFFIDEMIPDRRLPRGK